MLTIKGPAQRLCEGVWRRDFLRLGAIGGLGLSLPGLLRASDAARGPQSAAARAGPVFGRAKRCVLLFLVGGPPQHDTWDPKPDAPAGIRGELRPIATRVPGILVSELFPRLAAHAEKYCILRSVTHQDTIHTSAGYTMLTGAYHPTPNSGTAKNIRPTPDDHPHIGSILARARGASEGVPPFVSMPEIIRDDAVNEYPGQDAGFLGKPFAPFRVEADAERRAFQMPDVLLPHDVSAGRLDDRRVLLRQIEQRFAHAEQLGRFADRDSFYEQAFAIVRARAAREAFELDREPAAVRDAYGRHLFGQGCLLARRLLEAGVALVTVYWHYEGPKDSPVWDTHQNNFPQLRERLAPPTDQALASLLDDLSRRGMLGDTLVIVMGEFGRTPKVNAHGGRDHWPYVQSILLAGAGTPAGAVYGASDRCGGHPADSAVTPPDLVATFLHLLGIPPDLELRDRTNRALRASEGSPIRGLLG